MKPIPVCLVLVGMCILAGCETTPSSSAYDGEELYVAYCASCHGVTGAGDGPVAASLNTLPGDLRAIQAGNDGVFPRDEVIQLIDGRAYRTVHGTAQMPVWGFAFRPFEEDTPEQQSNINKRIEALTDHLATIQTAE